MWKYYVHLWKKMKSCIYTVGSEPIQRWEFQCVRQAMAMCGGGVRYVSTLLDVPKNLSLAPHNNKEAQHRPPSLMPHLFAFYCFPLSASSWIDCNGIAYAHASPCLAIQTLSPSMRPV